MIGPRIRKQPDILLCSGCECTIKEKVPSVGRKFDFREPYLTLHYCTHPDLENKAVVDDWPHTPTGCPALKTKI